MIDRLRQNPWPTVMVVCLGFFVIMLDATSVYVATPSMLTGLHASIDEVLLVASLSCLLVAVRARRRSQDEAALAQAA